MKTSKHFWAYLAQFFIEWEMFQKKKKLYRKSITQFYVQNVFPECRNVYEITWKNIVDPDGPQMCTYIRFECWIPKATLPPHTHTHSEYVILTDFPLQQ